MKPELPSNPAQPVPPPDTGAETGDASDQTVLANQADRIAPLPEAGERRSDETGCSGVPSEGTSHGENAPAKPFDANQEEARAVLRDAPRIPGYQMLDVLGRGGMGIVYLAEQASPRRIVALKTILAGPLASKALNARFRREIEAVGRVPHPNIVTLFEIGEAQGHPFFTMEYLGGGTLADRIRERRFTGDEAATILIKLARAVHSAHQFGFVHRDLKPSNILFTAEGTPKIADFGLVKWLTEAQDESPATRSGEVMGTLSYMSPEQAGGNSSRVDAASDVYSLGVILYEMLTGRCPFEGNDLITQILTAEVPSPAWLCPGISRNLERICLRALRKDPRERYQSAEEFARDLERFLNREPIDKPSVWYRVKTGFRRQWKLHRKRLLTIVAAVGLVAATATWATTGYLYRWEHTRYFNDISLRWLQIMGQGEVAPDDVANRFQTYEVVTQGRFGSVIRTTVIGHDGQPSSLNRVEPFLFDIRDGLPTESREVSYVIDYDAAGRLVSQTALDSEGAVIWQFLADYADKSPGDGTTIVNARYIDAEGNDIDTPTGAGRIRMTLDSDGWIRRVDFLSGKGTPAASTQGYFGFLYKYDDQHHVVQQTFVDADGKPMLSRDGVAGINMKHDPQGRVIESTYFDPSGKPSETDYGQASVVSDYDEYGNLIHVAAFDLSGEPAPLGSRGSNSSLVKETYGYEQGSWTTYTVYTEQDEVASDTTFEYDAAAGRILRTTQYFSAPNTVSSEDESLLDMNYLELESSTWDGGRDSGAIPSCVVYERDEFGRVISEHHYHGDPNAPGGPQTAWKVIENEYSFGRLAVQTTTTLEEEVIEDSAVCTVYEYDELGRPAVLRSYHGESPDPDHLFKLVEHEYDRAWGRKIRESYYGDEARSARFFDREDHWSQIAYDYSPYGRLNRKVYSGISDDVDYVRLVREYDSLERMTTESYWRDAVAQGEFEPVPCDDGWSRCEITFDRFGFHASEQYLGHESSNGFYEDRVEFRHDLHQEIHTYWDQYGQPSRFDDGNHRWVVTKRPDGSMVDAVSSEYPESSPFDALVEVHDEQQRVIDARWLDVAGNPVRNENGYQGQKTEYWPDGTMRRRERWGLDVASVGYPSLVTLFDEQGRIVEERAEDGKGTLVVPPGGYAIDRYIYDGDRQVEVQMIGFDQSVYGIYRQNMRFDEFERVVSIECQDEAGHIMPNNVDLFGRLDFTYDDEKQLVRQLATVLSERVGTASWELIADSDQRVLSEEFRDADGKLTMSNFGYARSTLDHSTNPPTVTLFDLDDQPVTCDVRIEFTEPGSVAETVGLQAGDIVLSYADTPITSRRLLTALQDELTPTNKEIPMIVRRGAEELTIRVPPGKLGLRWWEIPSTETP